VNEKPELQNAKFLYTQEGNTDGTTEEIEELEIELLRLLNDTQYSIKKLREKENDGG